MIENRCYLHRAPCVVPVSGDPEVPEVIKDGAVLTENGRIKAVGTYEELKNSDAVLTEHERSVLMPPLVNAHTHLELSHLAVLGQNPPEPGDITGWIKNLLTTREKGEDPEESLMAAQMALARLYAGGCRGVLDIGNLAASHNLGENFKLHLLFFHELLGLTAQSVTESLSFLATIENDSQLICTAHAPYSTSPELIKAIKERSLKHGHLFSIHLSESEDEIRFLSTGDGRLRDFLVEREALDDSFQIPGLSPVSYLDNLGVLDEHTLCVHCVHCNEDDLQIMARRKVTVCLCPGSNRFMGVGVAPVPQMLANGVPMILGTDSLASNPNFSLWEEMRLLAEDHPELEAINIIKIASRNGAEFMGISEEYGSLTLGRSASFLAVSGDLPFEDGEQAILNGLVSGGLSITTEWVE
jgi:cytosine/adenosine deaminase-related metal-dependent hydrolase